MISHERHGLKWRLNSTVCSTVRSGENHGNFKAPHHWPFVTGIPRWWVDSLHKGPIMQSVFPWQDIFMNERDLVVCHHDTQGQYKSETYAVFSVQIMFNIWTEGSIYLLTPGSSKPAGREDRLSTKYPQSYIEEMWSTALNFKRVLEKIKYSFIFCFLPLWVSNAGSAFLSWRLYVEMRTWAGKVSYWHCSSMESITKLQYIFIFVRSILVGKELMLLGPMAGLILGLHPTNERRRYKVTPPLIG